MGWSEGTHPITKFNNASRQAINLIKEYGQIDAATLKTQCDPFASPAGTLYRMRVSQNNHKMSLCLLNLLASEVKARLIPYQNE